MTIAQQRDSVSPPLTAAQLAGKARISVDTLRKIERGAVQDPGFVTIARVARAIDLNLDRLADQVLG